MDDSLPTLCHQGHIRVIGVISRSSNLTPVSFLRHFSLKLGGYTDTSRIFTVSYAKFEDEFTPDVSYMMNGKRISVRILNLDRTSLH